MMTYRDQFVGAAAQAAIDNFDPLTGAQLKDRLVQILSVPFAHCQRIREEDIEHPEFSEQADRFVKAAYDKGLTVGDITMLLLNGIRGLLNLADNPEEYRETLRIWVAVAMVLIEDTKNCAELLDEGDDQ